LKPVGIFVDVGHAEVTILEIMGLVREVREVAEAVLRCAEVGNIWQRHCRIEVSFLNAIEPTRERQERDRTRIETQDCKI
jgi:hypothetical protein